MLKLPSTDARSIASKNEFLMNHQQPPSVTSEIEFLMYVMSTCVPQTHDAMALSLLLQRPSAAAAGPATDAESRKLHELARADVFEMS